MQVSQYNKPCSNVNDKLGTFLPEINFRVKLPGENAVFFPGREIDEHRVSLYIFWRYVKNCFIKKTHNFVQN